ncbi:MAG: ATP phosphoribosyltransferase regulatory subunit [Halanaerobiales bacterium]|nr:ATP phosphoribosyltransferase regulatory subunit [Halanaerobiales bacterium]
MNAFVEGVRDILPAELRRRRVIYKRIRKTFRNADYREVITPTLESLELYSGIEGLLDKSEMFKVVDENGQILVLRPDVTMPIARLAATRFKKTPRPLKFSYLTTAYQSKNSQSLNLKEKTQAGVELIGGDSLYYDVEMIALLIKSMKAVQIKEPLIDIGHADLINKVMRTLNIDLIIKNKLLDLISEKNKVELKQYLKELNISEQDKTILLKLISLFGRPKKVLSELNEISFSLEVKKVIKQLEKFFMILKELDLINKITFDPMLISRHGYYTGLIFKGYAGDHNILIASGGRYDNLTEKFGKGEPAVGFALEVENILEYLNLTDYSFKRKKQRIIINYEENHRYKEAHRLAEFLRKQGFIVEIFEELKDDDYIEFQGLDLQILLCKSRISIKNISDHNTNQIEYESLENKVLNKILDKIEEINR